MVRAGRISKSRLELTCRKKSIAATTLPGFDSFRNVEAGRAKSEFDIVGVWTCPRLKYIAGSIHTCGGG